MKRLLSLIFLSFGINCEALLFAQSSFNFRNSESGAFSPQILANNGYPQQLAYFAWSNGSWVQVRKQLFTYNSAGEKINYITLNGNNDTLNRTVANITPLPNNQKHFDFMGYAKQNGIWQNNNKQQEIRDSLDMPIFANRSSFINNQWQLVRFVKTQFTNNWKSYKQYYASKGILCNAGVCTYLLDTVVARDGMDRSLQIIGITQPYVNGQTVGSMDTTSKRTYTYDSSNMSSCWNNSFELKKINDTLRPTETYRNINYLDCSVLEGGILKDRHLSFTHIMRNYLGMTTYIDSSIVEFIYLPNLGEIETKLVWNNGRYIGKRRMTTTQVSPNNFEILYEEWQNEWKPTNKTVLIYDTQNNRTNQIQYYWLGFWQVSSWQRQVNSYSTNNLLTEVISQKYDTLTNNFDNVYRETYQNFYNLPTATENSLKNTSNTLKIYPNPAKNTIGFGVSATLNDLKTIEIVDVLGKIVLSQNALTDNQIDVSSLERGVYFVKIINQKNETFVGKFIKE